MVTGASGWRPVVVRMTLLGVWTKRQRRRLRELTDRLIALLIPGHARRLRS